MQGWLPFTVVLHATCMVPYHGNRYKLWLIYYSTGIKNYIWLLYSGRVCYHGNRYRFWLICYSTGIKIIIGCCILAEFVICLCLMKIADDSVCPFVLQGLLGPTGQYFSLLFNWTKKLFCYFKYYILMQYVLLSFWQSA